MFLRAPHRLVVAWPWEPSVMGLVVAARHTYNVVERFSTCTKWSLGSLRRSSFIIGRIISSFLRFELRRDVIVKRRRLRVLFLRPGPKQIHSLWAKCRFVLYAIILKVWLCLVAQGKVVGPPCLESLLFWEWKQLLSRTCIRLMMAYFLSSRY